MGNKYKYCVLEYEPDKENLIEFESQWYLSKGDLVSNVVCDAAKFEYSFGCWPEEDDYLTFVLFESVGDKFVFVGEFKVELEYKPVFNIQK